MDLKTRAKQFLGQPVPAEIKYVPGSIAEIYIQNYAQGGKFDPELLELGELASMTLDEAIDSHSTAEAKAYFANCKSIIDEIAGEIA